MSRREPILQPVAVTALRPMQITLGFREVAEKRRQWHDRIETDGADFLGKHMIPVIKGPKAKLYVIDHHHLARALEEEKVEEVAVNIVADLASLGKEEFWVFCDNRGWCHPYDADGARCGFDSIPNAIAEMTDDPYRSLAGELRRAGGYAKDTTPFSEFIWADFLRRRIKRKLAESDFPAALSKAIGLSRLAEANHLPGWCGAIAESGS